MSLANSLGIVLVGSTLIVSSAFAQSAKMSEVTMDKGTRAKMAEHMEKMATCLKSDKSMEDCRKEAIESCPMKEKGSCMTMGPEMMRHGMGHGMGMGHMMGPGAGPMAHQSDNKKSEASESKQDSEK